MSNIERNKENDNYGVCNILNSLQLACPSTTTKRMFSRQGLIDYQFIHLHVPVAEDTFQII